MHPSLAPSLHTPECVRLIELLQKCHEDHPVRKFFGKCNKVNWELSKCLKSEREDNRRKSNAESREKRKQNPHVTW